MLEVLKGIYSKINKDETVRILFLGRDGSGKSVSQKDCHSTVIEPSKEGRLTFREHQANEGV